MFELMRTTKPKRRKSVFVSVLALQGSQEKILLSKRLKGKTSYSFWEFPGGKIENGETAKSALRREVYEELNIRIENTSLIPVAYSSYDHKEARLFIILYFCDRFKGQPKSCEGQKIQWIHLMKIKNLLMPPANKVLTNALENFLILKKPSTRR